MRPFALPLFRIQALFAASALGIAALLGAAPGCGGGPIAPPVEVVPSPVYRKPLKAAAATYEPWSEPAPQQLKCTSRDVPVPASCVGVTRCPVIANQALTCNFAVSEVAMAAGTAVFGLRGADAERPFGYWPAGEEAHLVSALGRDPRPTLDDKGALHVIRVEQGRLVDYRLDGKTLMRRPWDAMAGADQHLMAAGWTGDALVAQLSIRYSSYSKVVTGGLAGPFQERGMGPPPGDWPYPVVPVWGPGGYSNAILYGSGGVGLTADKRVWLVPRTISATAAERDVLPGGSLLKGPVFAFRSFDLDARSGVHFLFLTLLPLEGSRPIPVRDVHFLATRAARTNDCPQGPGTDAKVCTRAEIASEGVALAQTADRNPWLAFVLTRREHRALTRVVCPPPPRCPPGMPCRQAPCESIEKNVIDTVRRELVVVNLDPERTGGELGIRHELDDLTGVDVVSALDMGAVGSDLHVVLKAGDTLVRRLQLDTKAMRLTPMGPDEIAMKDTTLTEVR